MSLVLFVGNHDGYDKWASVSLIIVQGFWVIQEIVGIQGGTLFLCMNEVFVVTQSCEFVH